MSAVSTPATATSLAVDPAAIRGVLEELCALKGARIAGESGSVLDRLFLQAWAALLADAPVELIALGVTARALVATRLGGIDAQLLVQEGGASEVQASAAETTALRDALGESWDERATAWLAGALSSPQVLTTESARAPEFARRLAEQPRAGITAPRQPRLPLSPPESHAEHCVVVACTAALMSLRERADPTPAFLCGLAHHVHNAWLPDAGFAGETVLGESALATVVGNLRRRALSQLPEQLAARVTAALTLVEADEGVSAHAFQAADVLDRVLHLRRYERQASFSLQVAVDEYEIVHAGPLQELGLQVLDAAGLR
ncbi:MAG: hypothetical protein JO179_07285 [Solirubrobacterales bacterium]|nr:hypothetical protein [Solirubrobacterales bacterium]